MITVLAIAGWAVAAAGGVIALHAHRRLAVWAESIARASHELRGPLTAARLGLSPRPGPLPSESRLAAIDAELCRACVALDDLDEPGRPAPRLRTLERIGIEAFLGCCVEAWQGSAESAGVTLTLALAGPGASVWGDRARLAQAVGNLISNAIEHGGGAVEVRGCVRRGLVRVEVSDRGPGLPAPVAQRCGRARARAWGCARPQGRGHGLAIATGVAVAHGGRLAPAPSPHGACLVLELPRAGAGGPLRASG